MENENTNQTTNAWTEITPQFKTAEDLASAYISLQREHTKTKQEKANTTPNTTNTPTFPKFSNLNEVWTGDGFNEQFVNTVTQVTGLPQDTFSYFSEVVNKANSILKNHAETVKTEIFGGSDRWKLAEDYISHLPESKQKALAQTLNNPDTYEIALKGLYAEMASKNMFGKPTGNTNPNPVKPTGIAPNLPTGVTPLDPSSREAMLALNDPRYNSQNPEYDPNYHKSVQERILAFVNGNKNKPKWAF